MNGATADEAMNTSCAGGASQRSLRQGGGEGFGSSVSEGRIAVPEMLWRHTSCFIGIVELNITII